MSITPLGDTTRAHSTAPAVTRRPWLEHWLATCSDLSALKASHPMMDAVIDELDDG
jgi:8-amino-7-oxononanoate synthase